MRLLAIATVFSTMAVAARLYTLSFPAFADETKFLWSSGPWAIEVVPDTFYGAGVGCRLSLNLGDHKASFTVFFTNGPVVVEGPELLRVPKVGTLHFTDPDSGARYKSFGEDTSGPDDGKVEIRVPSQVLMQAIEGFTKLGTTSLVVSDEDQSFELKLDVTGLPEAAERMRNCVDEQGLML